MLPHMTFIIIIHKMIISNIIMILLSQRTLKVTSLHPSVYSSVNGLMPPTSEDSLRMEGNYVIYCARQSQEPQ